MACKISRMNPVTVVHDHCLINLTFQATIINFKRTTFKGNSDIILAFVAFVLPPDTEMAAGYFFVGIVRRLHFRVFW